MIDPSQRTVELLVDGVQFRVPPRRGAIGLVAGARPVHVLIRVLVVTVEPYADACQHGCAQRRGLVDLRRLDAFTADGADDVGLVAATDGDGVRTRRAARKNFLARALETARLELTVQLGKDATAWQWGRLHVAAPQHAVLGGPSVPAPVRELVNPRPLAVPGGSSIVNAMAWDAASGSFEVTAGPAMRMVVDLGDPDASTWVASTGTSGHPGSVHYTDQFAAWAFAIAADSSGLCDRISAKTWS